MAKRQKIEDEPRFKETIDIIKYNVSARQFIEIGGEDASFKNFINHDSWTIIDKYGNPDIRVDLDGRTARLPFDNNSIQCFILTEVLEHLRMGTPLIEEITRCLEPGGRLVISVPNAVSLGNRVKWIMGEIPFMAASSDCGNELGGTGLHIDGYWEGGHVVDFNEKRLRKYIERGGLSQIQFYKSAVYFKGLKLPKFLTTVNLGNFLIAIFEKPLS